jgi:serine/threonine protein kinase
VKRGRRSRRRQDGGAAPPDDGAVAPEVPAETPAEAPEAPSLAAGSPDTVLRLPGYQLLGPIATGGFSTVYRAYQQAYDRVVAVKVLTVDLTDTRSRERFTRECATTGRLTGHPNIVTVLEAGFTSNHQPFLAMPLLKRSLADQLLAEGPLDVPDVLRIGVKISGALETAHRHRILHRDLKPGNVLVSEYGEPALADFGIAAVETAHQQSMTFGAITPLHAPPELIDNQRATPASDVYSFASTLYKLVEGRAPHEGPPDESVLVTLRRIVSAPVRPPRRAGVPAALGDVLLWALQWDPERRPASAAEFGEALRDVQRSLGLIPTEQVYMSPTVAIPQPAPTPPPGASVTLAPSEPRPPQPAWNDRPRPLAPVAGAPPATSRPPGPVVPVGRPTMSAEETQVHRGLGGEPLRPPTPAAEPEPEPRPRRRWRKVLGVGAALLLIGAVAVGAFLMLRPDDERAVDTDRTTTTETTSPPSSGPSTTAPLPLQVDDLKVARTIQGTSAFLSWKNTNDEDTQYYVLLTPALPGQRRLAADGPESAAVTDLDPTKEYCFRVYSFPGNDPANGNPVFSDEACPPR